MADSILSVRFEGLGRETTNVTEWELDSGYEVSADAFSFTLFEQDRALLKGLELQPVELLVNGVSQMLGRIEVTERGATALTMRCEGRDYISEIVECNASPEKKFTADTEIGVALTEIMRPAGITQVMDFENISMAELRTGKKIKYGKRKSPKKNKASDYKPQPGDGIYDFCNRLIARHAATFQPGPARNTIVINQPDYEQEPLYQLVRTDDTTNSGANNIVRASARRDYSSFPTQAIFTGTNAEKGKQGTGLAVVMDLAGLAWGFNAELAEVLGRGIAVGESRDGVKNVLYRLLYRRDTESRNEKELRTAASRAISDRLKETLRYSATVRGHADPTTGALWAVNTMCQVSDSIADVNEALWIASRKFRLSSEGAFTDLEMWRPASFRLDGADL